MRDLWCIKYDMKKDGFATVDISLKNHLLLPGNANTFSLPDLN